jgi:hypothetical protein
MAKSEYDNIRQLMIGTVRIQLAALNAGIFFWKNWVKNASEFSQAVSKELTKASQERTNLNELLVHLTDISRKVLQQMMEIPNQAMASDIFSEFHKAYTPLRKRGRAAKAKH